jgi:hypothetical protein
VTTVRAALKPAVDTGVHSTMARKIANGWA